MEEKASQHPAQRRYSPEVKERAVRMLADHRHGYSSEWAAIGLRRRQGLGTAQREGTRVARCTVERLTRDQGLRGVRRGRVERTTVAEPGSERPAESFNGLYKAELIHRRGPWKGVEDMESATLTYVGWFDNRHRPAGIGYVTPAEFEQSYRQTTLAVVASSETTESL